MANDNDQLNSLNKKIEQLLEQQSHLANEVNILRKEMNILRPSKAHDQQNTVLEKTAATNVTPPIPPAEKTTPSQIASQKQAAALQQIKPISKPKPKKPKRKSDLEKLIGESIINKIGIVILIIGVGIGAKYSIDNELISPLTRVILGYLTGIGLLGVGMKLKKKFERFSAVLVSGAVSILYFITFFAYDFYGLIPQTLAFGLMVVFTVFAIAAALNYNRQIIALLGLVGAYAVPYLLSDGSGKVLIMFSYMALINAGILFIAFKKYWRALFYTAFALTWLIFMSWYFFEYDQEIHFTLALVFLTIFFITFYVTFLAYKLIKKEKFNIGNTVFLLINSFIFYGLGYAILNEHETGSQLLGLFTVANGLIHFIVCVLVFKNKLADKNVFYFIAGLVTVFLTLAFPVQLDGNWVTLFWIAEAVILFWIGRTKGITFYEQLSYALMAIASLSLFQDWANAYDSYYYLENTAPKAFTNIQFLSNLIFAAGFGCIIYIMRQEKYKTDFTTKNWMPLIASILAPVVFLFVVYTTFRFEIANYWDTLSVASALTVVPEGRNYSSYLQNQNYDHFKIVWTVLYTLFFVSLLSLVNIKKLKSQVLGIINYILNILVLLVYLIIGLYFISELREHYIDQVQGEYYHIGTFNLWIRYISYVFVAVLLFAIYKYGKQQFMKFSNKVIFEVILVITALWIVSSELLHWLDMADYASSYKLGLSILWGVFSLVLVIIGIWKNKKYLRVGAMVLFGITLIKLFLYDIASLNTISKTIVFVSLGILLLIISFLYNKFKDKIIDDTNK